MPSTIAQRLALIIDCKGLNTAQFERSIGASSGVIRKAIAQNTDIQSKWLTSIADNYPDISPLWLLTGRGEMLSAPIDTKADGSITHSVIGNSGSVKIAMHGASISEQEKGEWEEPTRNSSCKRDELLASKEHLIEAQSAMIRTLEELVRTKETQISDLIQVVSSGLSSLKAEN